MQLIATIYEGSLKSARPVYENDNSQQQTLHDRAKNVEQLGKFWEQKEVHLRQIWAIMFLFLIVQITQFRTMIKYLRHVALEVHWFNKNVFFYETL